VRYVEIAVLVEPAQVESVADVMRAITGRTVAIERPFMQPDLESDAIVDPASPAIVRAYADAGATALERVRAALASAEIEAGVSSRDVAEEEWAESWKEHFHVEKFGERIVVVPSWREYEPSPTDAVVRLDPGMAFGTGQHETTRMCLESLERTVRPDARVLDVGCGSGILAIAAARLGAAAVWAVDVDPDCARITAENATANDVADIVRVGRGSLGEAWPFDEPVAEFDVVVANIVARVIVDLAPELAGALAPGGKLVVSGVIGEREREVSQALSVAGLRIDGLRALGEWRCVEAVR
jgi:ribosomal protein L11 methyltransferase